MTPTRPSDRPVHPEYPNATSELVDVALIAVFRRIREQTQVLVARRRSDANILAGQWEIPGGKIEKGESPVQAAARELAEELHIECSDHSAAWRPIAQITPPPPQGRPAVRFFLFVLELPPHAQPRAMAAEAIEWVELVALSALEWPESNRRVVEAVTLELSRFE